MAALKKLDWHLLAGRRRDIINAIKEEFGGSTFIIRSQKNAQIPSRQRNNMSLQRYQNYSSMGLEKNEKTSLPRILFLSTELQMTYRWTLQAKTISF